MARLMASLPLAALMLAGLGLFAGEAIAQTTDLPSSAAGGAGVSRDLDLVQKRPYWSGGPSRGFVSGTLEGGLFYYRPQLAVGYGKPHWRWFGAESQTRFSLGSASEYVGARVAFPDVELRVGSRYTWAANQAYLDPHRRYSDDLIEQDENQNSRYITAEAELSAAIPLFGGAVTILASGYDILGVPADFYVFEEQLHVVAQPPWLWRGRVGYLHEMFVDGLTVGLASELIGNPERDHLVWRVGPQVGAALTHHLEASLSIMAVAASRDRLRLEGNDIGQLGFRYKWASGDPFPEFP